MSFPDWVTGAFIFLFEKVINSPLGYILRILYPIDKVKRGIIIDLKGIEPIVFNLGIDVPTIIVRFRISNYSLIDADLEKGGIQLKITTDLLRGFLDTSQGPRRIKRRSESHIEFKHIGLIEDQKNLIKKWTKDSLLHDFKIQIDAHFKSKMGDFSKGMFLQQMLVPCEIPKEWILSTSKEDRS